MVGWGLTRGGEATITAVKVGDGSGVKGSAGALFSIISASFLSCVISSSCSFSDFLSSLYGWTTKVVLFAGIMTLDQKIY